MKVRCFILAASLMLFSQVTAQEAIPEEGQTEDAAEAGWQICNETSFILRFSTAQTKGSVTYIDGWHRLRPSECTSEKATSDTARFLYAESESMHNGGVREWDGQVPICVNPFENFNIESTVSCALQGFETRRFLKIDPEESLTKLIEPDNFGSRSETAGLQRLLKDAGYKIRRVDGISGRRTRNILRDFLKENEVPSTATVFDQMDILAKVAAANQEAIGLTICNETEAETWLALGYREDGSWQSRGWWSLMEGNCIRPWSKDVRGTEMHLYAQQNGTDSVSQVLTSPVGVDNKFCVAESKFSALGREFCTDKGYVSEIFRPVITDEIGLKISLMPDDFVIGTSAGLRQ